MADCEHCDFPEFKGEIRATVRAIDERDRRNDERLDRMDSTITNTQMLVAELIPTVKRIERKIDNGSNTTPPPPSTPPNEEVQDGFTISFRGSSAKKVIGAVISALTAIGGAVWVWLKLHAAP